MDELEEEKDDKDPEEEDLDTDIDDPLLPGKKKAKAKDDDLLSLDDLTEEEDGVLPEDSFDDVDLW